MEWYNNGKYHAPDESDLSGSLGGSAIADNLAVEKPCRCGEKATIRLDHLHLCASCHKKWVEAWEVIIDIDPSGSY